MSADLLKWTHTGAAAAGAVQRFADACLGGFRSGTRAVVLEPLRSQPLSGVRINYVSGSNGQGVGTITVVSDDTVTWTAPGDAAGAEATLVLDTDVVVYSDDADKYVVLRRTTSSDLAGRESVQLLQVYNNAVAGIDFTAAQASAGDEHYTAIIVQNTGALSATDVTVWLEDDDHAEIALEATVSGEIQTIADTETAPTGLTFSAPTTEGTGLVIGTLTANSDHGLWIKHVVASSTTPAVPRANVTVHYSFTYDSVAYTGTLPGLRSTLNAAYYALFIETARPDPFVDTPVATDTTLPIADVDALAEGNYFVAVYWFNAYGQPQALVDADDAEVTTLSIDSGGDSAVQPPRSPDDASLQPYADGKVLLLAEYAPTAEGNDAAIVAARRADTWIYWYTTDGTAVSTAGAPTEVAMGTHGFTEKLSVELAAVIDATLVRAIVRTRRSGTPDVDSTNATEITTTSVLVGPARPYVGRIGHGRAHASNHPVIRLYAGDTYAVANDWKWVTEPGSAALYHDTTLIWRAMYDSEDPDSARLYIPNTLTLAEDSAAYTASGTTAYGVMGTSATVAYLYYVSDNAGTQVKVMQINLSTNKIRFVGDINAPYSLSSFPAEEPGYERFQDTRLQIFDIATQRHVSYMSIAPGEIYIAFPINQTLSAAAIEAL